MSGQPTGDDAGEAPTEPNSPQWPGRPALARPAVSGPAGPQSAPRPDDAPSLPGGGLPRQDDGRLRTGGGRPRSDSGWKRSDSAWSDDAWSDDAWSGGGWSGGGWSGGGWPGGGPATARDPDRPPSGALLPGEWARADAPGGPSAPPSGDARGRKLGPRLGRLLRGELRGGRLAVAAGLLALACTTLGGVIGGYIALHGQNGQNDPSYNVGTVPAAAASRRPAHWPGSPPGSRPAW